MPTIVKHEKFYTLGSGLKMALKFYHFMLKPIKHEISTAFIDIKTKMLKNNDFSCFKILICCIYPVNKC